MAKIYYRYYLDFIFKDNKNVIWYGEELLDFYNFTDFEYQNFYFDEKPQISEINCAIDQFKFLYKLYIQDYYKSKRNKIVNLEDIEEDIEVQKFFVYKKYYENEEDYNSYSELEHLTERIY